MNDVKKHFLDIFLREWALYGKRGAEGPIEHGDTAIMEVPFDADVSPGELRVFADVGRPMVGLVLLHQRGDGWLVVPTSEFTVPASEQEILVGDRVYQLWNAFTASDDFVVRSWLVETLAADDVRDVARALSDVLSGDALPEDLTELVGLPIVATDDPRLAYERTFAWRSEARSAEPPVVHRWVFACRRSLMGMAACFAILAGTVAVILRNEEAERPPIRVMDSPIVTERPSVVAQESVPEPEKVETTPAPVVEPAPEPVVEPVVERPVVIEKVPEAPIEKTDSVVETAVNEKPVVQTQTEEKTAVQELKVKGNSTMADVVVAKKSVALSPALEKRAVDSIPSKRRHAEGAAAKCDIEAACEDGKADDVPSHVEKSAKYQSDRQRMFNARCDKLKCAGSRDFESRGRGSICFRSAAAVDCDSSFGGSSSFVAAGAKEMSNGLKPRSKSADPASIAILRRNLTVHGCLPPEDSVHLETYVNYFTFACPEPTGDLPVAVDCELAVCPWNKAHRLLRIGVQGKMVAEDAFFGSAQTVAREVKLQLAPDSDEGLAWRPLGCEGESRVPQNVHQGWKNIVDLHAGRSVTVFYEIEPTERLMVKLRYKLPDSNEVRRFDMPFRASGITRSDGPSEDFRFASAVAEFALLLGDLAHRGDASFAALIPRARSAKGNDPDGRRAEFIRLAESAQRLIRRRDSVGKSDLRDDFL